MLQNQEIALASSARAASLSRLMAIIAAILVFPFIVLALIGQVWPRLVLVVISEIGFLSVIFLCRATRYRAEYAWIVMVSAWFSVISAMVTNGAGMGHVTVLWFGVIVCMAGLIGSLSFTYWWSLIAFLSLIGILLVEQLGIELPNLTPPSQRYALETLHTFAQFFIITALIIGYRRTLKDFEKKVDFAMSDLRAEVLQRQEAEAQALRAAKEKVQFIRNVSHEFRTPLNSIIGFSERLLKRSELDGLNEKALSAINRNGKQLHYFVNELLLLDAIEATDLDCKVVSVIAILQDVIGAQTELAATNNLTLRLQSDLSEHETLGSVDVARLSQAFANIILYCIRQSSPGVITIEVNFDGKALQINFIDNAQALPDSSLDTLFETHYEHVLNNEKDIPCSAFALKIAALIIGRHAGDIRAVRTGSCNSLLVILPLTQAS